MSIRALLLRCRFAREEIGALRRQIDRMDAEDELRSAGRYKAQLERREQEAVDDLAALENIIAHTPNARGRTVMRYFYLMGLSDVEIGEQMELSEEWVRKKRYSIIRALERAEKTQKNAGRSRRV